MRKSFDGLMAIIRDVYELDSYVNAVYLFCGRDSRKFKALHFDKDGFDFCKKCLMEAAGSSGSGMLQKPGSRHVRNSAGLWKAFLSISPKAIKSGGKKKDF